MEKLSALMDGELGDHAAEVTFTQLRTDSGLREAWDTYHLIGDALRGQAHLEARFAQRVNQRLADEPTVLAPRRTMPASRFVRRIALPIAASACGVALVVWLALTPSPFAPDSTIIAESGQHDAMQQPNRPSGSPENSPVNEYLLAHQQVAPNAALGMVSYVRTVSARGE